MEMYELHLNRKSGGKKILRFKAPSLQSAWDYAQSFTGKEDFGWIDLMLSGTPILSTGN